MSGVVGICGDCRWTHDEDRILPSGTIPDVHALDAVRHAVRDAMRAIAPNLRIPLGHYTEAIAFGFAHRNNAALRAALKSGSATVSICDDDFRSRLTGFGHALPAVSVGLFEDQAVKVLRELAPKKPRKTVDDILNDLSAFNDGSESFREAGTNVGLLLGPGEVEVDDASLTDGATLRAWSASVRIVGHEGPGDDVASVMEWGDRLKIVCFSPDQNLFDKTRLLEDYADVIAKASMIAEAQTSDGMKDRCRQAFIRGLIIGRLVNCKQLAEDVYSACKKLKPSAEKRIWRMISASNPKRIADWLHWETDPRGTAIVLNKIEQDAAAAILARLPREKRIVVAGIMATLEAREEEYEVLIPRLRRLMLDAIADPVRPKPQHHMAGVLEKMDPEMAQELLSDLNGIAPEAVNSVRPIPFGFDDIEFMDERSLAAVVEACPMPILALALLGVPKHVENIILGAFLERADARAIRNIRIERERIDAERAKRRWEARIDVARLAEELALAGKVVLPIRHTRLTGAISGSCSGSSKSPFDADMAG